MLRRRAQPSPPPAPTPTPVPAAPAGRGPDDLAGSLAAGGWVLPRGLVAGTPARWTAVGTVASPTVTPVDPAGLVAFEGWSLDWWIGGDDRWHLPAREAGVRQQPLDDAPVVETRVRIPGGDAVHRAYGMRSPRPVGDEWVVVEVENATAVPFAVALVIRPLVADSVGAASAITIEPVEGGTGRDVAHLVRVDGAPAVVLPRRPARLAVGNRTAGDVVDEIVSGRAGSDLLEATCPDGLATMAMVLPLTHTAVLRALVPVGDVGTEALAYPAVVPDAATVASGWDVHRRGPRFEIPESRLADAVARARTHLHLAHDGAVVRRDGHRTPDVEPGATEALLGAFDLLDRPHEVGPVVTGWAERLTVPDPDDDALFLRVVSTHWLLHRVDGFLDWVLPRVAAAVERLDKADRKGRLTSVAARRRAGDGLVAAAELLRAAGQPEAAGSVTALAERITLSLSPVAPASPADRLAAAAVALADGDGGAVAELGAIVAEASPTGAWPGPGPAGRPTGHDLAASAALVTAARNLLVAERPDGLALLAVHPDGWYGGGVELHDAPTAWGRLSYAIRWHGTRPALLWELAPHPGVGPARLTVPGLDPTWSTTELRGDALLAEVAPPAGAEALELVVEHPDIDPEVRRPGTAPDPSDPPPAAPEGGTFS